ncbi:hypothetical protein CK516_37420 [Nostoc sp. 'Peltigera malacea cyanobiont' DB3992]|nr:hypothetical protein CK516_37420 [Nostoc sp. 'Peltigera malacea cyanobiont' DB3992]
MPYLPSSVFSFDSFIQNTRKVTEEGYSGSRLSEVQEPNPQPPPRKRGGGYYVPRLGNAIKHADFFVTKVISLIKDG